MISFIVSLYARPSQKEQYNTVAEYCGFNSETSMYFDESINIYMAEQFWEEYSDRMDNKSFYKVIIKLNIQPVRYWGYDGDEYDEEVYSEIIVCERASSFKDLRETLHAEQISCISERVLDARNKIAFSKNKVGMNLPIFLKGDIFSLPLKN